MKKMKKSWIAVLCGALLMATLVGVVWARPNAIPEAQAGWRQLAIETSSCEADTDDINYDHNMTHLTCLTGNCYFLCQVRFPTHKNVRVQKLTMVAYDNDADGSATAKLYRTTSSLAGVRFMASAATSDDSADPQTVVDTSIAGNPVRKSQGAYILLSMTPVYDTLLKVYGFRIHYTVS